MVEENLSSIPDLKTPGAGPQRVQGRDGYVPVYPAVPASPGKPGQVIAVLQSSGTTTLYAWDGSQWKPLGSGGSGGPHNHTAGDGSGVLTNDEHDGYSEYAEISSPSTPTPGKVRLYAKVDGKFYRKDDTGAEEVLGPDHAAVTLAGTPDYLTLSGQVLTRSLINLASHVTNRLAYGNLTAATAASRLLGRGSAGGAGDWQEISLGSGLTMSGTTLSASGGGGGGGHTIRDEGSALPAQANLDFVGAFMEARDDASATATRIRAGYTQFDAIVDSDEHESLETGTATSVTATTLTRTGAGWATDQWKGRRLVITSGGSINTVRVITSNTSDTLTFAAITGLSGTPTYMIQNGTPVYRRLAEAIGSGAVSILYRKASGESAITISNAATKYILGDNAYDAAISVNVTVADSEVVFDQVRFEGAQLYLSGAAGGAGGLALGCRFVGGASFYSDQVGGTAIASVFNGAGSGATAACALNAPFCRVQACAFTGITAQNVISAIDGPAVIVGNLIGSLGTTNAYTGYAISASIPPSIISGNFVEIPTTATGGIDSGPAANLSGNYIDAVGRNDGSTVRGIRLSNRVLVTGCTFRMGTFSNGSTYKALEAPGGRNGILVSGNEFVAQLAHAGTTDTFIGVELPIGSTGNAVVNNLFMIAIGGNSQTFIGVNALSGGAADLLFSGNIFLGSNTANSPHQWVPIKRVSGLTVADNNSPAVLPPFFGRNYEYDAEQDWGRNALPVDWEAFGTGGTQTFGGGARGGAVVLATGAASGNDSGLRYNQNIIGGGSSARYRLQFDFTLNAVTDVRARIGLGEYAAWVTNMARPTDGLFFELDTAVSANFRLIMKTGAATQNIDLGAANTSKHRLDIWTARNGVLYYAYDGVVVFTSSTGIFTNLVCPGLFIRALAAADRTLTNDFMSWGCVRA